MWNEEAISEIENEIIDEQIHEGFTIDNDTKAEWAIKKITESRAELARFDIVCKNAISVYEAKMAAMRDKTERETAGLIGMLRAYSETVPMKSTKTQATYKLPSGTLKVKFAGHEFVRDEDTLVPWLESNAPDLVKVKKSADWASLKTHVSVSGSNVVDENGEEIPGVTVVEKPAVFSVEV